MASFPPRYLSLPLFPPQSLGLCPCCLVPQGTGRAVPTKLRLPAQWPASRGEWQVTQHQRPEGSSHSTTPWAPGLLSTRKSWPVTWAWKPEGLTTAEGVASHWLGGGVAPRRGSAPTPSPSLTTLTRRPGAGARGGPLVHAHSQERGTPAPLSLRAGSMGHSDQEQ